ncbi:MAG: U32 family peptidase [Deltaproteobacteria bacterium]|nr:U32 family peptidase [Deltaproteobacteria bacterium]
MNNKTFNKVELLAPAGNFEKLDIAIHYGADAVYLSGPDYSLRNFSDNFSNEELPKAIDFCHQHNVKVYLACNIYPRNSEHDSFLEYLSFIGKMEPDAIIISDPGILMESASRIPHIPIHLSTQSNTTNYKSVLFWEKQGVKRINVARELTLTEIKEIVSLCSAEIECFIHGAMCISYSGRCLLSSFMTGRDSNRGMCAHPCRYKYAVVEELRPGIYMPVSEDSRGSYIFNSNDLCLINHIPEIIETGITSLKIEGRMKGIHYVASTVKTYREAIDSYYDNPQNFEVKKDWIDELNKISHRGYCTGFYFGDPVQTASNHKNSVNAEYLFVGKVIDKINHQKVSVHIRNKINKEDVLDILSIKNSSRQAKVIDMSDHKGNSISFAQPNSIVSIVLDAECSKNDLLRRESTVTGK